MAVLKEEDKTDKSVSQLPTTLNDPGVTVTDESTCDNNNSEKLKQGTEGDSKNVKEEEEKGPLPPDGGWGWMVVLGCFLITCLIPMVGPCFGILFSRYLLDLGTSSTKTAWIFNLHCFMWNIVGLVTRPLTQEFGWRNIALLGSSLTALSFAISAFAPNAEFLFFSYSILCGAAGGSVTCICFTILPHYFTRRRGIANAIMMAGICLGQIFAPPFVQFLQERYGFRSATLLLAAIMLNASVGASLFSPLEWHTAKDKEPKADHREEDATLLTEKQSLKPGGIDHLKKCHSAKSFEYTLEGKEVDLVEVMAHARILRKRNDNHISEASRLSISSSLAVSTMDIAGIGAGFADDESNTDDNTQNKEKKTLWKIIARVAKQTISDLRILRSPRALIISLGATFCLNGYVNFIMMVPFAMQVAGHGLEQSAWCISTSAICNLLMRIIVSLLSDCKKFSIKACYVSGFVFIFAAIVVFPFLTDLPWMLAIIGVWGTGVGMNMGLYNLVMISVMGVENLAPVFGAACFMVAVGFITFGPIIGVIRDQSGSYSTSMWVISLMLMTSIILWSFMPAAQKYDRKFEEDRKADSTMQIKV
ncbi:monocarboxylate transporter 9-like [Macrobrachium nipponense]|uniref:monocarboxylate transporter 9-like n=1 Tax=Macrobrachium nipponense TaxID=159736 RepID=UPI0030C85233